MIHYLAYGSNLHPFRLQRRVSSARLIGAVTLPGYRMSFSKRSKDGSAKCTISRSAGDSLVYGALYSLESGQLTILDRYEGLGNGYEHEAISLTVNGTPFVALTYIAAETHIDPALKPYHWYKALVLAGAGYHQFPAGHIETIQAVSSVGDPDMARRCENEALLTELT